MSRLHTVDALRIRAPRERIFEAAAALERWPEWLRHYRWVRWHRRDGDTGLVEMACWRPFGPVGWPCWWLSEVTIDRAAQAIRFRHVRGITTGMDVAWEIVPDGDGCDVRILHWWDGPAWGPLRHPAAHWVIGPVFVHGIAGRTLRGFRAHLEAGHA
ncbi:MAG: SRPBCC family protein [Gemmatimonadales bacterium]|nr:SRPBCC family protein [Gemmatimonadales bacterium]